MDKDQCQAKDQDGARAGVSLAAFADTATHVRGEIRVQLARTDITRTELAQRCGVSLDWLSRRLTGTVGITLEDLDAIAAGLRVPVSTLLP